MSEEKLQLKHLAPYLPYELLMFDEANPNQYYPRLIGVLNDENIITSLPRFPYSYNCGISTFKPILRPLSGLTDDLLKEIFNDENLVVERLKYATIVKYQSMGEWFKEIIPIREVTDDRNGHLIYSTWLFIELCKRHFDVFGLIDKGLAIDINTIGGNN